MRDHQKLVIQLSSHDSVAIALCDLVPGMQLKIPPYKIIDIRQEIPTGHKVALEPIALGRPVLRYGQVIGYATEFIHQGDWVHTHNLSEGKIQFHSKINIVNPLTYPASNNIPHFMGFKRADGRAGTRNYIAVISTVNCISATAQQIARAFTPDIMSDYPNVDGVVAVTHSSGCSIPSNGLSLKLLHRTLENLLHHPNIGGAVLISLGCEVNQMGDCNSLSINPDHDNGNVQSKSPFLVVQQLGGVHATIDTAIAIIRDFLPKVNALQRTSLPVSWLTVGLQCGASDAWSGITANPLVGLVTDRLTYYGASAVLAETTELFGAEHFLTQRVVNQQVGERLVEKMAWWQEQAARFGFSIDNNPTPGNKAGGLTTIYEKSLGAVAKAGSSPLNAVYDYGEKVVLPGLVFMDTPGNDPCSVTGQVAGGCNLILFTTGRGSVFGNGLAPTLKIVSNSETYQRLQSDIDFNAGPIVDGESMHVLADRLIDLVIDTASGKRTRSEWQTSYQAEIYPWQPGAIL